MKSGAGVGGGGLFVFRAEHLRGTLEQYIFYMYMVVYSCCTPCIPSEFDGVALEAWSGVKLPASACTRLPVECSACLMTNLFRENQV